jgi:hypothetical protein
MTLGGLANVLGALLPDDVARPGELLPTVTGLLLPERAARPADPEWSPRPAAQVDARGNRGGREVYLAMDGQEWDVRTR